MDHVSITQGIFFYKPKKTNKKSSESAKVFLDAKYFEGFAPPVDTVAIRTEFYRKHVFRVKMISSELKQLWHKDLIDNVYEYVKGSESSISDFQGAITPLAFIITGMLQDENKELIDNILLRIKEYTPHVASISSKACANVKAAFQFLCHQIMEDRMGQEENEHETFSSSELDEELIDSATSPEKLLSRNARRKVRNISANDLQGWFRKSSTKSLPIVICIEDIDLFPVNTVQNLIMAFGCIKLPVIFIAGITSYCETFDAYVPQKCPTTFVYRTFTTISPDERLTQFMERVLFERASPFQLSGPVLRYLTDIFSLQEFSISRLEQILHLCLLEHYRLAESVLCAEFSVLREKVLTSDTLTPEVITETFAEAGETDSASKRAPKIKIAKSVNGKFGNFEVTSIQSSPRKKTTRQAGVQIKEVEDRVLDFIYKQLEWFAFTEFLYAITRGLPGVPSAFQSIRSLYTLCWDGGIFKARSDEDCMNSALDVVIAIFDTMARLELQSRLKKGLKVLKRYQEDLKDQALLLDKTQIHYLYQKIEDFIAKLENIEEEERKLLESAKEVKKKAKPKTRTEWIEQIKTKAQNSGHLLPKLRESIVISLNREAKRFLSSLGDHSYSKAFIFDDVAFLEEMITPNTAKRIHAALLEPEKFLNCSSCANPGATALDDMSHLRADISVVYNVILEQQMRNVNLNVIFESFKAQVEDIPAALTPKKRRTAVSKQKKNENFLIRFRHVIAELQQMGFIKQSKSRVHIDEVSRLNFGF